MNIENVDKDISGLRTKADWRKWVKTKTQVPTFSASYLKDFLKHFAQPQSTWGVFSAINPEPQILWNDLADELGIRLVYPKIISDVKMDFFESTSLKAHPQYQILEPDEHAVLVKADEITGIFVPGLAFDNRGYRLGRGKGYYDRFLMDYQGLKVGLCNHDLFVLCPLPKENWDVRMDYVVTNEFIFRAE